MPIVADEPDFHLPAAAAEPGSLTYEIYFGLREKPFSLSPNPRFFFRTKSHGAAFAELLAGIRRREGILALTGEVGTGKTTLCRAVLESLDRKTFAAFVPDPILSREDLLKTLLVEFGVVSVDEIRAGHLRGASRTELMYPLKEFLQSLQPLNAFAVVMIDEAQNLPSPLLEEIRILTDLEQREKLLQLMLIGQPELQQRLAQDDMRQLRQRLSVRCELAPLSNADVGAYVAHRLAVAGSTRVSFTEQALRVVAAASGGIPRVINLLCDRALLRAARAGAHSVGQEYVLGAAEDLKLDAGSEAVPEVELEAPRPADPEPAVLEADVPARTRHGLPPGYRMRHDAHYVEELEAIRRSLNDQPPPPAPNAAATLDRQRPNEPPERTIWSAPIDQSAGAKTADVDFFGGDTASPRRRAVAFVAAVFVFTLAIAGLWRWRSGRDALPAQPVASSAETPQASVQVPDSRSAGPGEAAAAPRVPPPSSDAASAPTAPGTGSAGGCRGTGCRRRAAGVPPDGDVSQFREGGRGGRRTAVDRRARVHHPAQSFRRPAGIRGISRSLSQSRGCRRRDRADRAGPRLRSSADRRKAGHPVIDRFGAPLP